MAGSPCSPLRSEASEHTVRRSLAAVTIVAAIAAGAILTADSAASLQALKPYKASCVNRAFTAFYLVSRPTRCIIAASPQAPFARAANLTGLRWKRWRSARAVATGYELGFHLPLAHVPALVVLTRPGYVEELGIYVYRHFRVTTKFGKLEGNIQAG